MDGWTPPSSSFSPSSRPSVCPSICPSVGLFNSQSVSRSVHLSVFPFSVNPSINLLVSSLFIPPSVPQSILCLPTQLSQYRNITESQLRPCSKDGWTPPSKVCKSPIQKHRQTAEGMTDKPTSIRTSVSPSVHQFICRSILWSFFGRSLILFVSHLSICPPVRLSLHLRIHLSINQLVRLFFGLSIRCSVCASICQSMVLLSVHLSI